MKAKLTTDLRSSFLTRIKNLIYAVWRKNAAIHIKDIPALLA